MSTSAVPDGRFPRLFAEESRSPNLSSVTPGICLLVVAFFLSVPEQSVGQAPPIVPEASSPQQPGTEFRVNVRVGSESENIQNLNQIGFDLSFEQQHLSHVDDKAGSFLGEVQYASNVDSENGTVEVGVTRTDDEGRSGSGVVAQVRLAVGQDVSVGTELTFSVQNVRAEDPDGNSIDLNTQDLDVTVKGENESPSSSFTIDPSEPDVGETVTFDASGSEDPDGTIAEYRWDFDADGDPEATGPTASTSFESAGENAVTLTVEDNDGSTSEATETVPVNALPVAESDTSQTSDEESVTTDVLANDSDPDGSLDESSVQVESGPSDGTTTVNNDGKITYAPDAGFSGTDSYTYTVADNDGARSSKATVTINVTENVLPMASFGFDPDEPEVGEAVSFDASSSEDPDGSVVEYRWDFDDDGQTEETSQSTTTSFSFTSAGEKPVTLAVEDNEGEIDEITKSVTVVDSPTTQDPVASADTFSTDPGGTLSVEAPGVLQNDSDPDGDSLEASLVTTSSEGDLTLRSDGGFEYEPNPGFVGTDHFRYAASGPEGLSDTSAVQIQVTPSPPAPNSLVAAGGEGRVVLSWVDDDSTGSTAGYNVYRSTSSFGDKGDAALVNEGLVSGSPYTDTTAQRGKTYYYRITAANGSGGESGLSGEAITKTLQEGIAISVPDLKSDTGEVSTLSVEANLGTAETEGYTNLSFVFDSSVLNIVGVRGGDDLTFGPESPVFNQEGDTLRVSSVSGSPPVTGQGELLQVDVELTKDSSTTFEAASSNVSRENAVSIGPDGNIIPTSVFDDASSSALLLADSTGRGTVSFSEPSGPPDSPAGLTVVAETGSLTLDWSESSSAGVNRYRIYRDTAPIASSVGVGGQVPLDSTEASTTSYTDTTATAGTEYYYRVTAVDTASNESDPSNEVSGTPQEADVEEGLIAYYPFSGSAEDATGNGNSGTVNGATLTTDRSGNAGEAYDFDGEDDYINVPDDAVKTSSGSVCAWFLARSKTDGENDRVFSMSNFTSPGGTRLYLSLASGEEFRAAFISDQLGDVPISFGEWQHTCFTWDDTSSELYLNGNLEDASSGGEPTNGRVNLGSYGEGFKSFLDGKIDQVRIYDRPLSESEVQQLYGKGGGEDGGKYAPGNGYEYLVTERQYDPDDDDISSAIDQEFGEAAELADWNTLKDLYADDKDGLVSFLNGIGMKEGDNAYVQRGGEQYRSGDRHYFIKRHNGDPGDSFLVHDDLHSNTLSLGSWYNPNPALVRLPLEELSPPVNLTANPSDGQVDLSWGIGGDGSPAGYNVYRSPSPFSDISEATKLNDSLIAGTDYADTEVSGGTEYFYRAAAVDTTGNESALSGVASAYLQPEAVEASVARTFGEASGPGDYRLVALPGAPDTSLAASVSGEAGAEWQAYREAGEELRRYQSSAEEDFAFQKGRGYWLTSRQEWALQDSIEAASLQDSTTAIPLNPGGWTIVANPFGEAVPFSALNRANGGDLQALWPFGGAFSDTSAVFKSAREGQAYYLFSEDPGRDSLRVPHPALTDGSGAGSSGTRALQAASGEVKTAAPATIALSARPAGEGEMGPGAASTVRVGLAGERGPGTLRAPPGGLEAVSLRVVRGGQEEGKQGEGKRLLMRDRRRAEGEGETFRLRLESHVEGPIQIQARGADSLGSRSAALIDRSEKTTYDLSRDGPIQVRPGQERRRLEVAVGTDSYVEGKREEAMPEKVRLTSYPNPAGRRATVEYALPEAREVTLQVYDVLGRRVATLEQGRKKAGRHTARLETGRLSSGVYFGRLEAGEQTRTQKITVVR
ncbi:fibronectin type 3 domain-containing protein [Salinibacter ruber]|uniref:Fibronectin type 3 domain-containing protein n=1 Tax=Salinibacter ruber TaxID=146919 RepID=A0A9X2TDC4_9BACT|nr:Ig-like domain-containing protein [Salinibacter ruber]MCS3679320.1 fibronectin type 3 domain-containing protein [Salinibacter ruber]MCS3682605.1 fibronectin type 3 domain-containing protein [Salinibacter ruber]